MCWYGCVSRALLSVAPAPFLPASPPLQTNANK
jgi:hypothetical protein